MEGAVNIRRAAARDVALVQDCATQAYAQYVQAIGRKPAPMVQDFAWSQVQGHLWVTDPFMGYVSTYRTGDAMHLEGVAVMRAYLGQGIGKALIQHCEEVAQELGLCGVELYTNIHMIANQTLYPALGYQEVDRRRENGFDRVYYRKQI